MAEQPAPGRALSDTLFGNDSFVLIVLYTSIYSISLKIHSFNDFNSFLVIRLKAMRLFVIGVEVLAPELRCREQTLKSGVRHLLGAR